MKLEDKIGREEIVDKIFSLVNNLKQDEHFCLALNGAWGSGKTFVLRLLEEKFETMSEYIVIKYDAWENTFYSEPLIAIIACLIDGLQNRLSKFKGYKKAIKELVTSNGKKYLDKISESNSKIGTFASIIKDLIELIPQFKTVSFLDDTKDNQMARFKSYQSMIFDAISLLNKITEKKWVESKQTKMIILVDEIDRCLPDEQLKILERLHHLFDVKNCVVIVAMNQASVAKTVKTIYGVDGYEYLRKFFDFTFKLETSSEKYLRNLFDGFISSCKRLNFPTNEVAFPVNLVYQCLLYGDKKTIQNIDNRELTRYYESVQNVCNDFGWEKLNQQYVYFILLALFIKKHISTTFLSQNEIIKNQKGTNKRIKSLYPQSQGNVMPYYDYIDFYLGIDRRNPPKEIVRNYNLRTPMLEFTWVFNEIIPYSLIEQFDNNELSTFYKSTVNVDDCKKLVRLVILYGGEQEQCEK